MRRALSLLSFTWALACAANEPRIASAVAGLPEYTPEESSVFDATLATTVFYQARTETSEEDPKLLVRATQADSVVHARVATVTAEKLAGRKNYTLGLVVDGPPILGRPSDNPVELHLGPGNPSLVRVADSDVRLVGRRVVLFLRRYADQGEAKVHFHADADEPALLKALEHAKALDDVRAKKQR